MLRGTVMYLFIFVMLRLVVRRQIGGIAVPDILVIVLMAEVIGNGISDNFQSIGESVIVVVTILFWSTLIEWLQSRYPSLEPLLRDPKLKLIDDGHMIRRNMRKEFVSEEELLAELRGQGLEDLSDVKIAYMEANGSISIIRRKNK